MNINEKFKSLLKSNSKNLETSKISLISNDSYMYQNTLNLTIGKPGSGKTLAMIYELAVLHDKFDKIIYITRENKVDKTFNTFIPLIKTNILHVLEEDFVEFIIKYIEALDMIIKIKNGEKGNVKKISKYLGIEEKDVLNSKPFYTFILFEDASDSKLFDKKNSIFVDLLRIFRHYYITSVAIIHSFKFFPIHLREYVFTITVFKGFSKQRLNHMYGQSNITENFNDVWEKYKKLIHNVEKSKTEVLIFDFITGFTKVKTYDFN